MTETNFFYWLQGFFELSPGGTIDSDRAACILRHIDLVDRQSMGERLYEVRTLVRLLARPDISERTVREIELTGEVRRVVSEQFLHVIDPQAGGPDVQAKLNEAHAGDKQLADLYAKNPHLRPRVPDGKPVARC